MIIDEEERSIKTEAIRQIIKNIYEKPIKSNRKIYIINDSEKMTKEAQNTLLKTLEEPPEYTIIILITSNENMLLNTIKSRCAKVEFNKLNTEEIINVLKQKGIEVDLNLLKFSEGSVKKTLQLLDKKEILGSIINIFSNIEKWSALDFLNTKDLLFKDKDLVYDILDYINIVIFNNIKENYKYVNCIQIIEDTKERLRKNSNYDMSIDNLLLKMWEEING